MTSPVYWHPAIYHRLMKILYGNYFEARYKSIADLIPDYATVTEVCAGDAYLFKNYLKIKNVKYTGLDINSSFVKHGQKNNIQIFEFDLLKDEVPVSDYIIIQASLYQFIPEHEFIVRKLLASTKKTLLIVEPIRNLALSSNRVVAFIAKYSANPGENHKIHRFNRETLMAFFRQFEEFESTKEIEGGRELIGIFRK